MVQLGLIGAGISRSSAPRLHVFLGEMHGISVDYKRIDSNEIPDFEFDVALHGCAQDGYRGVNVTHPFKEVVRRRVEVADPLMARIGAINTVIFETDGWQGYNTDFTGFSGAFRHRFGTASPGTTLVVGAGGVGKAIAFSLVQLGAGEIWLYDTDKAQSEGLADGLKDTDLPVKVIEESGLRAAVEEADGLVNGTPVGMFQHPGNPFPANTIGGQRWAFDAVYTPMETEFLKCARAASLDILSGYDLFLFQGFHAFKHFTGVEVDAETAIKAFPPPENVAAAG